MNQDKAEQIKADWLHDLERTNAYFDPSSAVPELPPLAVERKKP